MSGTVRTYRDLVAWQLAMDLACAAHAMVARLPGKDRFVMGDQIVRAAISVPANIAEGSGSGTRKLYLRHLRIARGSLLEVRTLMELVNRLNLLPSTAIPIPLARRTDHVLQRLIASLE